MKRRSDCVFGEVKVKSSDFTLDLTHGKQVICTQKGQNKSQCEDSTRKEDTQAQQESRLGPPLPGARK